MKEMKILSIIVTYNAMRWIDKCVESLLNSTVPVDIFVKDNGSTDGTIDYVKNICNSRIVKLVCGSNIGFGKANNIGLQFAIENRYDYVYLMNQDAWILRDTISTLVKVQQQNKIYGILSPLQYKANLKDLDSNFYSGTCSYSQNKQLLSDLFNNEIKDVYEVPMVMASHWLISINCLEDVGGFSPAFHLYGEDDNFAQRVVFFNYKIGIVPSAKAVHDRGERIATKSHNIKLANAYTLKILLNPNISKRQKITRVLKGLILNCCRCKSIMPALYLIKIIFNIHDLIKIYKNSKIAKCAYYEKNTRNIDFNSYLW